MLNGPNNSTNKRMVFGDNKSVVDSSSKIQSKLHKRHAAWSFHRVLDSVAARLIGLFHINGEYITLLTFLSKHWGYSLVWSMLQSLLFWRVNTNDLYGENMFEWGFEWNNFTLWGVTHFHQE